MPCARSSSLPSEDGRTACDTPSIPRRLFCHTCTRRVTPTRLTPGSTKISSRLRQARSTGDGTTSVSSGSEWASVTGKSLTYTIPWGAHVHPPSRRTLGSSLVDNGLSWWQATICIWIAATVAGTCMALNSRAAANYHVGYPVVLRTCFGMYGHYWPVLARGVCACLWVSVISQSFLFSFGAHLVDSMASIPGRCLCLYYDQLRRR